MNPIFQYQVMKAGIVTRAYCPHCRHSFEVLRKDSHRQLSCINCGKKFKIAKFGTPLPKK